MRWPAPPDGASSNTPSSSGRPCPRHIGSTGDRGHAGEFAQLLGARRQQRRVAPEAVEHEAADQRALVRWQQLVRAVQVREGAAAVDVGDEQAGRARPRGRCAC